MLFEIIKTKSPKFSMLITLPRPMIGLDIARLLERRTKKKILFEEYRTVVVEAIINADVLIEFNSKKVEPYVFYEAFWVEITTNKYEGDVDSREVTLFIEEITDCSK